MTAIIIRKKDVEKLGRGLIKEVYELLHDDYFRKTFPVDIIKATKAFNEDLVRKEFRHYHYNIKQSGNSWNIKYEDYDKSKFEEDLQSVINKIKDGTLDTQIIFETLNNFDLDMEIDEDLYFKNKAFLNLYKVFDTSYTYLED